MENTKVYCIIVTYNAMKWIDKCLGSLSVSSIKTYPVIVDNNSKDETVSYIAHNYPEVFLIVNKKNKGFGQANNQGIEYAYKQGASHFFLLNQDAWIYEDTVKKLIEVQDRYNISVVSPIHFNGQGDLLDYNYFINIVIDEINIEYVSDIILGKIKSYYTVFKINAAAWMLSRRTIERIGGFDPIYFHYGEDGNYCQRIKYHQGEVAFVTKSYIHHDRERKGNMKAYKKNAVIMMLLYLYSDINSRFWKIDKKRIIFHFLNCKYALSFLFKLKIKEFMNLFSAYFTFFLKIPQIRYSMKKNKQTGSIWLDLK